jgi:hypothetical protein
VGDHVGSDARQHRGGLSVGNFHELRARVRTGILEFIIARVAPE